MKLPFLFAFSVLHFIIAVCCILTTISIAVVEGKLQLTCGLYLQMTKTGSSFTYSSSSPDSTCKYVKIMPGITFAVSLVLMAYHLYPAISRLRRVEARYNIGEIVCWCITIATGILLFVASCIISVGFTKSCSQIKSMETYNQDRSCEDSFDTTRFDHNPPDENIYKFLTIAEITSWTAFLGTAAAVSISSLLIFSKRFKETHS